MYTKEFSNNCQLIEKDSQIIISIVSMVLRSRSGKSNPLVAEVSGVVTYIANLFNEVFLINNGKQWSECFQIGPRILLCILPVIQA